METRYRVLGLGVTALLYACFVLWPRTAPRKALPPLPPAHSRPATARQQAGVGVIPPVSAGGGSGPLADRGDLALPPRPQIALNIIPPVPPAAGGGGSVPFRTVRPGHPGKTNEAAERVLLPWQDPSGKPIVYLRPKSDPAAKKEKPEKTQAKARQKHREKLLSKGSAGQAMLRRENRVLQFQQQRSEARHR